MSSIHYYPIDPNCVLIAHAPPEISEEKRADLDAIWKSLVQKSKTLYDGRVFCVESYTTDTITGFFIPYRFFAADKKSFSPLGISGITTCNKKVLIGKRAKSSFLSAGYYECVPSGSVESVDFIQDAIKELYEEAHIPKKSIIQITPLGLFYDEKEHLYDIALHIDLQEKTYSPSSEYDTLEWVSYKEFLKRCRDPEVLPLSKVIFDRFFSQMKK